MNIREIVNKVDSVTTDEAIFVVQEYIFEKKQQRVEINLLKGNPDLDRVHYDYQHQLLGKAFQVAKNHFLLKRFS